MAPTEISSETITRARSLRRDMTEGERKLWSALKEFRKLYGLHVRKRAPIGPFIADFVVHSERLVIEVDGEHHFEPERMKRDASRDSWLANEGYRVLRFNTGEIAHSFDGCVEEILRACGVA